MCKKGWAKCGLRRKRNIKKEGQGNFNNRLGWDGIGFGGVEKGWVRKGWVGKGWVGKGWVG